MNWTLLLSAIAIVESSGNPKAYNASSGAAGLYQIRMCVIEDVNSWGYHFHPDDRYDPVKAGRIAVIYLSHYDVVNFKKHQRPMTQKELCGTWNQGYTGMHKYPDRVDEYWAKVKFNLEQQKKVTK